MSDDPTAVDNHFFGMDAALLGHRGGIPGKGDLSGLSVDSVIP
ncbi:MAG TPA: hypothetical protein VGX23_06200 [Actinocrinis sp.]|nr:hypothetical protein [Actinocrinis sp.]